MSHNILSHPPLTIVTVINKDGLYVVSNTPSVTDNVNTFIVANKPRGLHAARKLRTDRRLNRWVRSLNRPTFRADRYIYLTISLGRQILQKARSRQLLQDIAYRRLFTRKGHRPREGGRRGETTQFCHPQVCACTAN